MLLWLFLRPKKRWYIHHVDARYPYNGEAYFGPFKAREVDRRLNDAYGDMLAYDGNLEAITLSDKEVRQIGYINPREFWMDQLKECFE